MGLAAPQLGAGLAAAVVRPPDRGAAVVLLNPRVVDASAETDEQYEGCLSFFDYRGLVPRPLRIDVEHARWDGTPDDHLVRAAWPGWSRTRSTTSRGRLYVDRMAPGVPLVPVEEYRETGRPWRY